MKIRRGVRGVRLVSATLAIVFLMAAKCEDRGKTVDTNPNDPNPKTVVYVVELAAWVDSAHAPYEVTIEARSVENAKEVEIIGPLPIANGEFKTTLEYNEGRTVQINMKVKASRYGSTDGYCRIKDGLWNHTTTRIGGGLSARCTLTTARG